MKYFIYLILLFPLITNAQEVDSVAVAKADSVARNWYAEINKKGIEIKGDSVIISEELFKLIEDNELRKEIYPDEYTWEQTADYINKLDLKKAFWFFINLYDDSDTSKQLVVKAVLSYDRIFNMEEIMVNTFYTYCFLDPEIGDIVDGKPEIRRPDILEGKLKNVQQIVAYIKKYRDTIRKDTAGGSK